MIKKTIENTLANIPGIICDGAKISCAAKIAACLDAAFLAHHLAMNGSLMRLIQEFSRKKPQRPSAVWDRSEKTV